MYKITLDIQELPEGPYLGTSPELPGLVVQGESVQQVLQRAPDLAHDLIAVMVETGQPLPRDIETVIAPSSIPLLVPA